VGTSFRTILLPRDRSYSPSPQQLERAVSELVASTWLPTSTSAAYPGPDSPDGEDSLLFAASFVDSREGSVPFPVSAAWLEQLLARDSAILWSIEDYTDLPLTYPFTAAQEIHRCDIVFHLPTDYAVDRTAFAPAQPHSWLSRLLGRKTVDPFSESGAVCDCGVSLEYKRAGWSYATERRLRVTCPGCKKPFNPSEIETVVVDNFGNKQRMKGGIAYRFAIYLDCDKALPGPEGKFSVSPELLEVLQRSLGTPVDTYPEYY
jgi:hypothetical protein